MDETSEADGSPGSARPSKTARKREALARRDLGRTLADLTPAQLQTLPLPEHLRTAVDELRQLTAHGARRRQLLYVGGLLRKLNPTAIEQAVEAQLSSSASARTEQHRLERWRERLLQEPAALTEYLHSYPATDRQQLRSLLTRLRKAVPESNNYRTLYRELFRFLRANHPA